MGSRSLGFEWPVYAAAGVLLVGRVTYYVVYEYQSKGIGGLIAYLAVVAALAPFVVWGVRRGRARQRR